MTTTNKFKEKQYEAEILSDLYDVLVEKKKSISQDYRVVEENYRQRTDWRTGELLWEDEEHTIPRMEDRYDYVTKLDSELDDNDRIKIKAIESIMGKLEKLL